MYERDAGSTDEGSMPLSGSGDLSELVDAPNERLSVEYKAAIDFDDGIAKAKLGITPCHRNILIHAITTVAVHEYTELASFALV